MDNSSEDFVSDPGLWLLVGLDEELFWSGCRGNPILGRLPVKEDSNELIAAVGEGSSFLEYDVHLGLGHR